MPTVRGFSTESDTEEPEPAPPTELSPEPLMLPVESSVASLAGYDPQSAQLHITFNTGRTVVYHDVPEPIATQLTQAKSFGKAFHSLIKNRYHWRYT